MRYLCLVHSAPEAYASLTEADQQQLDRDSFAYDRELEANGNYITSDALRPPEGAVIIRVRNGEMSSTDGPFIETKEQLAGFIVIEARDLNDAIRLAAGIPMARIGAIEVRAMADFSQRA